MEQKAFYSETTLRAPLKPFSKQHQNKAVDCEPQKDIQPCTIILVDDDLDDRYFVTQSCKGSPHVKDVIALPDGMNLIQYLKDNGFYDHSVIRYNPLLIVLDLQMPGMNGFEVLEELKSDVFLQEVPIIVLSSLDNKYPIAKAFGLGADGYLTKPLNLAKLEKFLPQGWQWPPESMW